MKSYAKKIKDFAEQIVGKSNRGVVANNTNQNDETLAYQYGRSYGTEKVNKLGNKIRDIDQIMIHKDDQNHLFPKSGNETVYGAKTYTTDITDFTKENVDMRVAEQFYDYSHNKYNKADPVEHEWFKETNPEFFQRQLAVLEENCEAYIYDAYRTIFPAMNAEDHMYDYLIEKGYTRPNLHFWKIVTPGNQVAHNGSSNNSNTNSTSYNRVANQTTFLNLDTNGAQYKNAPLFTHPGAEANSAYRFKNFYTNNGIGGSDYVSRDFRDVTISSNNRSNKKIPFNL